MSKILLNNAYKQGSRIMYATFRGNIWTTDSYIAEAGYVTPRLLKRVEDRRQTQNADNTPKLDTIIDSTNDTEPVKSYTVTEAGATRVNDAYDYNTNYFNYILDKYGIDNLSLEPIGKTSKILASDGDGAILAIVMGLSK